MLGLGADVSTTNGFTETVLPLAGAGAGDPPWHAVNHKPASAIAIIIWSLLLIGFSFFIGL